MFIKLLNYVIFLKIDLGGVCPFLVLDDLRNFRQAIPDWEVGKEAGRLVGRCLNRVAY